MSFTTFEQLQRAGSVQSLLSADDDGKDPGFPASSPSATAGFNVGENRPLHVDPSQFSRSPTPTETVSRLADTMAVLLQEKQQRMSAAAATARLEEGPRASGGAKGRAAAARARAAGQAASVSDVEPAQVRAAAERVRKVRPAERTRSEIETADVAAARSGGGTGTRRPKPTKAELRRQGVRSRSLIEPRDVEAMKRTHPFLDKKRGSPGPSPGTARRFEGTPASEVRSSRAPATGRRPHPFLDKPGGEKPKGAGVKAVNPKAKRRSLPAAPAGPFRPSATAAATARAVDVDAAADAQSKRAAELSEAKHSPERALTAADAASQDALSPLSRELAALTEATTLSPRRDTGARTPSTDPPAFVSYEELASTIVEPAFATFEDLQRRGSVRDVLAADETPGETTDGDTE